MTSDRWAEVDRLYHAALERSPEARASFLAEACAGDEPLRREVESLLRYEPAADGFLERPALRDVAEQLVDEVDDTRLDFAIAGYTILRMLGEGGMGVVYLAEQTSPIHRQVALKLIKRGMDTRQVVARFEAERQALAVMNHPHIAAVYDAGTTADGRPYFVMEYVDGVPITAYCDRHTLSTQERLELFTQVCGAVQHAHQKGVIHRDIKPSNVLVSEQDGRPMPKVIDFGIAKATQRPISSTAVTEQGSIMGTPEYMSPEQAALSSDIDTTTDVYSLGVVLYELLVGVLPFDPKMLRARGYDEMRRVIRESDPPKPSSRLTTAPGTPGSVAAARRTDAGRLTRSLRGDLDWITLKALEKDRRHRYATVAALSSDIERFLAHRPIEARPPSALYRMRKFTRRYRGTVTAAAIVLLVLVAGLTVSIREYLRAEAQSIEKEHQRVQAEAAALDAANQKAKAEAATSDANNQKAVAENALVRADRDRAAALAALRDKEAQQALAEEKTAEANHQRMVASSEAANATASRMEAEQTDYAFAIADAEVELRANSPLSARARLQAVPEKLRGWEWQHLFFKTDTSFATLAPETPCARPREADGSPATSSDNVVAVRNPGGRIYLRRCASVEEWSFPSYTHLVHQAGGTVLAVGPAGEMLVARSGAKAPGSWEVQFLDSSSRAIGQAGPFDAQPICADISRDGRRAAIGLQPRINLGQSGEDAFQTWEIRTGRLLAKMLPTRQADYRYSGPRSCLVAFSPDTNIVATSGATVHVWYAATGTEISGDTDQAGFVSQPIAWNSDGSRLAIGRATGLVDIWNVADGRAIVHLDGNGLVPVLPRLSDDQWYQIQWRKRTAVLSLAFSQDGSRIFGGANFGVGVWDVSQRKLIRVLAGHEAEVIGVSDLPGGRIVSADAAGTVKLWPAGTLGAITSLPGTFAKAEDLALSGDGTAVAVTQQDGGVFVWRLSDLGRTVIHPGIGDLNISHIVTSLTFGRDGNRLLAANYDDVGTVETWAVDSGRAAAPPMRLNTSAETDCGRPSAESPYPSQQNSVTLMQLSPDGRSLAFRQGRCVVMRDLSTQKTVATLHEYPVSMAFLPDGALVVMSHMSYQLQSLSRSDLAPIERARVLIWDWKNGRVRSETPAALTLSEAGSWRAAICGESGRIAIMSGRQGKVSIWDAALSHEISQLSVPPDTQRLACSSDGRRIATAAEDVLIRIWDVDHSRVLLTLTDDDQHLGGLAFTPDGRLVAGRTSGGLTIWETHQRKQ